MYCDTNIYNEHLIPYDTTTYFVLYPRIVIRNCQEDAKNHSVIRVSKSMIDAICIYHTRLFYNHLYKNIIKTLNKVTLFFAENVSSMY